MANKAAGKSWRRLSPFHREEGQVALEFVLVLPLFFMFFLVLVDFGLLMYQQVSVSNAVREGTRFGAVNCGVDPCLAQLVRDRTIARSGGVLDPATDQGEVEVGWYDNDADGRNYGQGDSVIVRVTHPYNFAFVPGGFSMNVASCADMRLEQSDQQTSNLPELTPPTC